ncbi:MAG: hypothetical protein M0Z33_02125 [Actinomycetota bacterium]|nr:hypothetical protein [Actinomycetota bacterium]
MTRAQLLRQLELELLRRTPDDARRELVPGEVLVQMVLTAQRELPPELWSRRDRRRPA